MLYYTDIGGRERAFTFQRRGDQLVARCGDRTYRLDLSMVGDGSATWNGTPLSWAASALR